jgi:predicted ATP-dependent serine protease
MPQAHATRRVLYTSYDVHMQAILQEVVEMQPVAVIIDSIQTVYLDDVNGSAGSVSQARALL